MYRHFTIAVKGPVFFSAFHLQCRRNIAFSKLVVKSHEEVYIM